MESNQGIEEMNQPLEGDERPEANAQGQDMGDDNEEGIPEIVKQAAKSLNNLYLNEPSLMQYQRQIEEWVIGDLNRHIEQQQQRLNSMKPSEIESLVQAAEKEQHQKIVDLRPIRVSQCSVN